MTRKVFYSFHYDGDSNRASLVRNMGVIEGNRPAHDNDWESVKRGGDAAIRNWIDGQLIGKSCAIILIGQNTAGRRWINYEIEKSWNSNKGVFGIYVHQLKSLNGHQSKKGGNPFDIFTVDNRWKMSSIVNTYDPPYIDSQQTYNYIRTRIAKWIEEAITIREKYS